MVTFTFSEHSRAACSLPNRVLVWNPAVKMWRSNELLLSGSEVDVFHQDNMYFRKTWLHTNSICADNVYCNFPIMLNLYCKQIQFVLWKTKGWYLSSKRLKPQIAFRNNLSQPLYCHLLLCDDFCRILLLLLLIRYLIHHTQKKSWCPPS